MHRMLILLLAAACSGGETVPEPAPVAPVAPPEPEGPKYAALFGVLPDHMHVADVPADALIDLGRMLYYETRLSKNHDVSCNTCHLLDKYGVDNLPTSSGHKAQKGARNSPTTYNAALHIAQFWDGRAPNVEEQAKGPVLNPVEMAMPDEASVVAVLKSIPGYVTAFEAAFPGDTDPVTYEHFAVAVGAFERGLVTANSKFDQYLEGKADALTPEEAAGLDRFVSTGCITCHSGVLLGGAMYQKAGAVIPWETPDLGRFDATKNEADKHLFKVPSLRNIAETAPYFHDGSVDALPAAVQKMAKHQLGKDLPAGEAAEIVAFLKTTTGELPMDYIKVPELPKSGPTTPKAQAN